MAPLHNLPLRAMANAVWWALHTLLTAKEFWAGLAATLTGVVAAFELERWRARRHSREQYARALNAVRYETARLHSICQQALTAVTQHGASPATRWRCPRAKPWLLVHSCPSTRATD